MDNYSGKNDKEEKALRKLIRDLHGVNGRRPSALKNQVLKNNLLKSVKTNDVSPSTNYLSATTKVNAENLENKTEEVKDSPKAHSVAIESNLDTSSRKKSKLDVELNKLRKTVQNCEDAIVPIKQHVHKRLEYYESRSRNKSVKESASSLECRKRKKLFHDESDLDDSDGNKSDSTESDANISDEDCKLSSWNCAVDGLKMTFNRINEQDH